MGTFLHDVRYAVRSLTRERSFSIVAILTLAIALGATSAIFTVVNAILLRPLPYSEPQELLKVRMRNVRTGDIGDQISYANYNDLIAGSKSLEGIGVYGNSAMFLMEGEDAEIIYGLDIEARGLAVLGVQPARGRWFTAEEDVPNGPRVLLLSHELWKRRFNSDPNIVNRSVRFGSSGTTWTVIGVMPEGFKFPATATSVGYYAPLLRDLSESERNTRNLVFLDAVVRLRDGMTVKSAQAEADVLSQRLEKEYPESNSDLRFVLEPLHDHNVGGVRTALLILFAAVTAVLLISCANVANLLLARASARQREISVRSALGATRMRIVRQLLAESIILSVIAGALGLGLAAWGIDLLLSLAPSNIPRVSDVTLDARVVSFTLAISFLTGIIFGLVPAMAVSKRDLTESLKEGTRGSTEGRGRNRLRNAFVTASVAMSLVLLAGAGLLMRSFMHVTNLNAGFDPRNATAVVVSARVAYKTPEEIVQFQQRLLEEVRNIPGVVAAGAANMLPLGGGENVFEFEIEGRAPFPVGRGPSITTIWSTPGFLGAMRIPILRGRDFSDRDSANSPGVAIVSKEFVRRFFPNEDPIGKRLRITDGGPDSREIVGVADDIRYLSLTSDSQPIFYLASAQSPKRRLSVVARGPASDQLAPALRAAVKRVDPLQPVIEIQTLEEMRAETLVGRRFSMVLLSLLSAIALVLAAVGIYSIMSYNVTQRTSEIGIRMAIGAEARDIFRLVVGNALKLVGLGAAIGLVISFGATRALRSLLYGITPSDPATFVAISAVIMFVALIASWIPARRAAHVDPLSAIRHD